MSKINRAKEIYENEGIPELCRSIYRFVRINCLKRLKIAVYGVTDRWRITSPDTVYNETYYTKRKEEDWRRDAEQVSETIHELFNPDSVIDFGCAIGNHLEYFHQKGVDINGVEGSSTAINNAVVPRSHLTKHDLRDRYHTSREFDVAICIEVAEHLAEPYSEILVESITDSASVVVFTAAEPNQGGTHHVNEKPRDYWIKLFSKYGFKYDKRKTKKMADGLDLCKTTEVADNLFIFVQRAGHK